MPRFSAFYLAYMQSPAWQTFRERVKRRDGYRCVQCGSRRRLEVDHLTYARLGREALSDCQTLCHACHARKTRRDRRRRWGKRHGPRLTVVLLAILIMLVVLFLLPILSAWHR